MRDDLSFEVTDAPAAVDLDAVDAGLHLYNLAAADLGAVKTLACFARAPTGAVAGGLRARIWGTAVEVQQLWVDESWRSHGEFVKKSSRAGRVCAEQRTCTEEYSEQRRCKIGTRSRFVHKLGAGARLMRLPEDEARRRGATLIYLDTFSFQAPGFYERLGFSVAARLDGFPDGIAKFLMVKRLSGDGGFR